MQTEKAETVPQTVDGDRERERGSPVKPTPPTPSCGWREQGGDDRSKEVSKTKSASGNMLRVVQLVGRLVGWSVEGCKGSLCV